MRRCLITPDHGTRYPLIDVKASPLWAYGTVIVNHTAGVNELVCSGANNSSRTGG